MFAHTSSNSKKEEILADYKNGKRQSETIVKNEECVQEECNL
jgi:hypothetical protein